jgi:hypothetical protein
MAEWDSTTKATVQKIPLLTVKAGPRDKDDWSKRLKEVRNATKTCQLLKFPPQLSISPPPLSLSFLISTGTASINKIH